MFISEKILKPLFFTPRRAVTPYTPRVKESLRSAKTPSSSALRLAKMPPKQGSRRGSKEDTPAAAAKPKKVEAPVLSEEEQKLIAATTEALNQLIEQGKDVASELKVRLRSSWSYLHLW